MKITRKNKLNQLNKSPNVKIPHSRFISKKTKKTQQNNLKFTNTELDNYSNTSVINDSYFRTYTLNNSNLYKILNRLHIKPSSNPNRNHIFGFNVSKNFFNTKFYMLNRFINRYCIINKSLLYINCKKYFINTYKKYLPNSFILTEESQIDWSKKQIYLASY